MCSYQDSQTTAVLLGMSSLTLANPFCGLNLHLGLSNITHLCPSIYVRLLSNYERVSQVILNAWHKQQENFQRHRFLLQQGPVHMGETLQLGRQGFHLPISIFYSQQLHRRQLLNKNSHYYVPKRSELRFFQAKYSYISRWPDQSHLLPKYFCYQSLKQYTFYPQYK